MAVHAHELTEGLTLVDESRDDIGKVVEVKDNHVTLSPLRPGAREWEAEAHELRLATPLERIRAKVAAENYATEHRPR